MSRRVSSRVSSPKPLAELMQQKQPLSALLARADALLHLEQLLHRELPAALRPLCHVAAFRDGHLRLVVEGSQWATHLRYQERRLCRALQALPEFLGLARIVLKVKPQLAADTPRVPCPPPPESAAESLRACAQDCSDAALRRTLERLACHAEKNRNP